MVLIILLILLFLIKSSQIYFGYRSINNKILPCWASILSLKLEISVLSEYFFFTSEKKKKQHGQESGLEWGFLAVILSKEHFTLTSWKTDSPPLKSFGYLSPFIISIPCLHLQHWKVLCKPVKWWPIIQAYQHLGCKSKNSTGDLRLPQEPFQCSRLTCPSFVAHQHAKAGPYRWRWHQSCSCYFSQHALPTKLSWGPW